MEKEDGCLYSISYGGDSVYIIGKVAKDRLVVSTNNDDALSVDFMFGCSMDVKYMITRRLGSLL